MCMERKLDILFGRFGEELRLTILRQLERDATCPAKSDYTCYTPNSGFSLLGDNVVHYAGNRPDAA